MRRYIFPVSTMVIIVLLSIYFFLTQNKIKKQLNTNQSQYAELTSELAKLVDREEITLKKLKIINKFGDTIIELSENEHFNGAISLSNKSKINTIYFNGGNKDENPGILILKGKDEVSFALMVQDKQNLLNIYNKNGLDTVSIGTDEHGHGGYSIKNANEKVIKTEGWGGGPTTIKT